MPWRWVGLKDEGSNKARITEDGELLVRTSTTGGGDGSVTIAGVDTTDELPVSLTSISATNPVNAILAGATEKTSGPVAETGFGGGPGTVVAPAADAVITNHFPGVAGELHMIEVVTWFSEGTPAAADNYNMAFKFGGTVIANLPVVAAINVPTTSRFYFNSAEGTPFGVHAVDAGTAGVGYNAFLTATRLV